MAKKVKRLSIVSGLKADLIQAGVVLQQAKESSNKVKVEVNNTEDELDKLLDDLKTEEIGNTIIKDTEKMLPGIPEKPDSKPADPKSAKADSEEKSEDKPTDSKPADKAKRVPKTVVSNPADSKPADKKPAKADSEEKSEDKPTDPKPAKADSKDKTEDKPKKAEKPAYKVIADAYAYAETDTLKTDMQAAIRDGVISDNLRVCLEILVDNESFRQFILSQCEIKRKEAEPQYVLGHEYRDVDGDGVPDIAIEALGNRDLGMYNIEIRVIRKDKSGKKLGDASASEAKKYLADLEAAKGGEPSIG